MVVAFDSVRTATANEAQFSGARSRELVIIIRPSFMIFCKDACRAALLNHILFWIAWKAKDQTQDLIQAGNITYYATNEELIECMADAWSDKKVRTEVNALIDLGVIGKTKNQKWGTDRTKHFFFGKDQYNKLIELCEKHAICLAHIGLPKEVIQMLAAFSQSVKCPCSGQTVNLPDANGKFTECNESFLPNATSRFYRSNNKDNCKDTDKDNCERENSAHEPKDVVSSHPPTRPSKPSQNVSSQDEIQEEIILTESGQHIYDFACKTLFIAKKPKMTLKLKDECELLALHIKTFEQFQSLLSYVQSKFDAPYHLKNMINELNDWLQVQSMASKNMQGLEWLPTSHTSPEPEATQETTIVEFTIETYLSDTTENVPQTVEDVLEDFETTDQQLVDKMLYICHDYGQDASIDVCLDALSNVRDELSLHNTTLFDFMTEAYRVNLRARTCDVQSFFDELYASLSRAFDGQEQLAVVC